MLDPPDESLRWDETLFLGRGEEEGLKDLDTDTDTNLKTKMVKAFYEKCPTCGKEVSGLTEKRVEGLMAQHRLLAHGTKVQGTKA